MPNVPVDLDAAEVIADVKVQFERYEKALVDGDLAVLDELFWDDPRCLRYGVADRQAGAAEIAAQRRIGSVREGRHLRDTRILAIGRTVAVVNTLIAYPSDGLEGRQTQTWVRFPEGWRVVSAHVSEIPTGKS
jgi:hypothetical protein